ncbi:unnamed protein product [Phaedon cochleariae]|uniref:Uncharacterized protein n=1 Tax=Phaedon cochleariae TaxID=80249 RepID=A0A9N9SA50_PHACE|nr:unnamed protein product [Phaedon cochleariae]
MTFKAALVTLACLGCLAAQKIQEKRQVISSISENQDNLPAETGFTNPAPVQAAAAHQGSKYFQYIHVPAKDHVDHGHKMGNEHHFIERHEKEHPHAGEFKTKVRWGDKHGGYGEHYWDYNHAGHDNDGDGEGSHQNAEYAEYEEESKIVPIEIERNQRGKRQQELLKDVEFIDDKARSLILESDGVQKHGGNYRRGKDYRRKREQKQRSFGEGLVFDADLGVIIDEKTGVRYNLSPIPKFGN